MAQCKDMKVQPIAPPLSHCKNGHTVANFPPLVPPPGPFQLPPPADMLTIVADRMINLVAKKESKWKFDTSAGGGVAVDFSVSGGLVRLKRPESYNPEFYNSETVDFLYGGVGLGYGFKIPKIKIMDKAAASIFKFTGIKKVPQGAGSTTDLDSVGIVYVGYECKKDELEFYDFEGPCFYLDAGFSATLVGHTGTVLLAGLSSLALINFFTMPAFLGGAQLEKLLKTAKAIILMHGQNRGMAMPGVTVNIGALFCQNQPLPSSGVSFENVFASMPR